MLFLQSWLVGHSRLHCLPSYHIFSGFTFFYFAIGLAHVFLPWQIRRRGGNNIGINQKILASNNLSSQSFKFISKVVFHYEGCFLLEVTFQQCCLQSKMKAYKDVVTLKDVFHQQLYFIEGCHCHMGDFTQPQQKYTGTGENCNIAIPVIFYPVIKTL